MNKNILHLRFYNAEFLVDVITIKFYYGKTFS